jgi:EamA domain-containing membrane protein RarD
MHRTGYCGEDCCLAGTARDHDGQGIEIVDGGNRRWWALVSVTRTNPTSSVARSIAASGVVLYLYATFHGLLSLSALLTSFYPAFTVLSARLVLNERLSVVQASGALAAIVAVALIAAILITKAVSLRACAGRPARLRKQAIRQSPRW